jgi:hypothetical protein
MGNSQAGAATDQPRCRLPDALFSLSVASLATKDRRFTCSYPSPLHCATVNPLNEVLRGQCRQVPAGPLPH